MPAARGGGVPTLPPARGQPAPEPEAEYDYGTAEPEPEAQYDYGTADNQQEDYAAVDDDQQGMCVRTHVHIHVHVPTTRVNITLGSTPALHFNDTINYRKSVM